MPEKGRPGWLKIVAGTDHDSGPEHTDDEEAVPEPPQDPAITANDLVELWVDVTNHLPADYISASKPERVASAAGKVRGWKIAGLHKYLSRTDKWIRPSFTRAVIEEVRQRMILHNFSPRE